jgi:Co/Zn/Cd efflux system component
VSRPFIVGTIKLTLFLLSDSIHDTIDSFFIFFA